MSHPFVVPLDDTRVEDSAHPGELAAAVVAIATGTVFVAVGCAAWLTMRIGVVALPVTLVLATAWGWFAVWMSRQWSDRPLVLLVPALVWALTLIVLNTGPGGDMPVPLSLRGLGLLVAGTLLPAWMVFIGQAASTRPPSSRSSR